MKNIFCLTFFLMIASEFFCGEFLKSIMPLNYLKEILDKENVVLSNMIQNIDVVIDLRDFFKNILRKNNVLHSLLNF